jgi:hypothetical protein
MAFAAFMASGWGRGVRIVAGVLLIAWGLLLGGGVVPAVIGLVPLIAGVLDICLLAPLFGAPLKGAEVRARAK